jgi:hypothetical protein
MKKETTIPRLLEVLDKRFEEKFYESIDADAICSDLKLSRQELQLELVPLLANGWVEKDLEGAGGYFRVRLTPPGKEQFDRASGNSGNVEIRQRLLGLLAHEYERDVHSRMDSDAIAAQSRLDCNKVCFNLRILETHGWVGLEERAWAGHPLFMVSLTPEGKVAYENPQPNLAFLSHAAMDEEMAQELKDVIESSFAGVDVFVSSDPEDLPPGNLWAETIRERLASAQMLLVLATARGLTRKWVWFETGAGWGRSLQIIPCCVGKVRKGELPPPFSWYQALNVDDESDLRLLLDSLGKVFGPPARLPDFSNIVSDLVRLDVRAEEREKLRNASGENMAHKTAIEALIVELEDNWKAARQMQVERSFVAPANSEWLKWRTHLAWLPPEIHAGLTAIFDKTKVWKTILDSGVNPLMGSMEIPRICIELRSELPPLIDKLKNLLKS